MIAHGAPDKHVSCYNFLKNFLSDFLCLLFFPVFSALMAFWFGLVLVYLLLFVFFFYFTVRVKSNLFWNTKVTLNIQDCMASFFTTRHYLFSRSGSKMLVITFPVAVLILVESWVMSFVHGGLSQMNWVQD